MARHYGLFAANPFGQSYFEKAPRGSGDFRIPAGESVTFRYRFLFQPTGFDADAMEQAYRAFAAPASSAGEPKVTLRAGGSRKNPCFRCARIRHEVDEVI